MATVSVRCITNGPLGRTAAILRLYRPVSDEIVCFVNGLFTEPELAALRAVCDEVVPVEMTPSFTGGRYRPWMIQYGKAHDWVSLIDHDEVPGAELLRRFRELSGLAHVAHLAGPRRWLYPTTAMWLNGTPWEPNFKMFLTRTTPTTLQLRAPIHADMPVAIPYRLTDLATYHLVLLTQDTTARLEKVRHYQRLGASAPQPTGFEDRTYYLPEDIAPGLLSPVPALDRELIDAVMRTNLAGQRTISRNERASRPAAWLQGTVGWEEVSRHWPGRDVSRTATSAQVELWGPSAQRPPEIIAAGVPLVVWVRIVNTSAELWPREGCDPVIRIGAYWRRPGVAEQIGEARAGLGADVRLGESAIEPLTVIAPPEPGRYELVIDMVAEGVTWFDAGLRRAIQVTE